MKPISTDADFRQLLIDLGMDPDEDYSDLGPEDLSAIPKDQWEPCMKVTPPAAILRYLASGDTLTDHTIDMMELAMEKAYGMESPWCITSMRSGTEGEGTLAVNYFYLLRE